MKSLRKRLLTLLALTLFGGMGAWAQGPTNVIEITTDLLPASWATENSDVTLAELQALGFEAVDASVAQAWTGAPQGVFAVLIYGFDGGNFNYILFDDNGHANTPSYTSYSKNGLYSQVANDDIKLFFTGAQEIELTKVGDNQWSLGQTPDYDLELQVEYYQKYALKNIPEGWTVMVNGIEQTRPYQGDSLLITETDSVVLVPSAEDKPRVKSVTLEEEEPVNPMLVPLTMEALTAGTIVVDMSGGSLTMKYSKNGGDKTTINATTTINVAAGDKVQFYGDGTNNTSYNLTRISGGTASVKVYGNVMSLVDEENFATATTLNTGAFRGLFDGNVTLTDASELLLPATTLADNCYCDMFYGCIALTTAPALPATTLAEKCYYEMFMECGALTTAPVLPATTLATKCYYGMFWNCSALSSVTCLATDISASRCLTNWLKDAGFSATSPTLHVKASMGSASWNNENFTVQADQ